MSDDATTADEWKAKGNAALKVGSFLEALEHYTKAIETDPSGHVFYSNRASCYLTLAAGAAKLGKPASAENSEASYATKALADAQKCMSIKPDFYKGHSHAANALCRLGRFGEAVKAAEKGLEACPDAAAQKGLKERLAEVTKTKELNSMGFKLWGDAAKKDRLGRLPLRALVVAAALVYLFPLPNKFTAVAYRQVMIMSLFNIVWHLFATYGRPRLSKDYAARLIKDRQSHMIFLCALCMNSRPSVLALFPIAGHDFVDVGLFLYQVTGLGGSLFTSAILPLMNIPQWYGLTAAQKKYFADYKLNTAFAMLEVVIGLVLLLELATPLRSLMTTIFFWQFLRIRYMIDEVSQTAFATVNQGIRSVLPGPVGQVYEKVAGFLHGMGKLPEPGERPSALSGCTIS